MGFAKLFNFRGIDFFPHGTLIPFISARRIAFVASGLAIIASLALFMAEGLNYGIDFRGGTLMQIKAKEGDPNVGDIRAKLGTLGLGDIQIQEIQEFTGEKEVLIRIETQPGGDKAQAGISTKVKKALGDGFLYRKTELVGPTVSRELIESGTIAVVIAILSVLIYIWLRFEWQFSLGAVAALVHDVILTIGVFALFRLEFNLSIIAALLTIVGYSLNDTVVVYDRVRENLRKYKKMALPQLLDRSINDTLSRTILTSATTLIALFALYIFGTEVIRGFTFAMIWGIFVGTYSSIFVAAPLLISLGIKRDWSGVGGAKVREPKPAPAGE